MSRSLRSWINLGAVAAAVIGFSAIAITNAPGDARESLFNLSCDPTRELYQAIKPLFVDAYEKSTGSRLTITQSHGGSPRQAAKIIAGELSADVVTLGQFSDIDVLRKRGLIADGWIDMLPNHSLPYTSTVVFVVRKGNPHGVKGRPDLIAPNLEVITPDPRT